MPRKGQAIAIDNEWRAEVITRLKAKGWTRADLSREAHCSKSDVTMLLNGKRNQSPIVIDIERALGMRRRKRVRTEIQLQIDDVVEQLDDTERRIVLERALTLLDARKK